MDIIFTTIGPGHHNIYVKYAISQVSVSIFICSKASGNIVTYMVDIHFPKIGPDTVYQDILGMLNQSDGSFGPSSVHLYLASLER